MKSYIGAGDVENVLFRALIDELSIDQGDYIRLSESVTEYEKEKIVRGLVFAIIEGKAEVKVLSNSVSELRNMLVGTLSSTR